MIVHLLEPIHDGERQLPAGLRQVSPAQAQALFSRGRCRPATQDEIEQATPRIETAEAPAHDRAETATPRRPAGKR